MKKIFFLSIIFFFSLALTGFNPVKADSVVGNGEIVTITPALSQSDYEKISNVSELVEFLKQGGSIDITNSDILQSNDPVENLIDSVSDFIDGTLNTIAGYDTVWNSPFDYQGIGSLVPISNKRLGDNIRRFRNWLPSIKSDTEPATPDTNYIQYINKMNTNQNSYDSFYWGNFEQFFYFYDNTDYQRYLYFPLNQYSYHIENPNSSSSNWYYRCLDQTTINIFEQDNRWYYTVNTFEIPMRTLGDKVTVLWYGRYTQYITPNNNSNINNVTQMNAYNNSQLLEPQTYTDNASFNNLELLFQNISVRYRNVNIVVNGVTWANVGDLPNIDLGHGTYIDDTNTPIEYKYNVDVYIDVQDIIDRLDTIIRNQNKITFPDIEDLILDVNGQRAVAVTIVQDDIAIDDALVKDYGTLIPLFPVFVSWPVAPDTIANIATVGIVNVVPDDLIQVFLIAFLGMIFVAWIHRLIE